MSNGPQEIFMKKLWGQMSGCTNIKLVPIHSFAAQTLDSLARSSLHCTGTGTAWPAGETTTNTKLPGICHAEASILDGVVLLK